MGPRPRLERNTKLDEEKSFTTPEPYVAGWPLTQCTGRGVLR